MSPNLPRRIQIVGTALWMRPEAALRLLQLKNAIEVFSPDGTFLGIKLGNYGPAVDWSPWPPAELPGVVFEDPNPERRYASLKWQWT